jgi:hypothetical protein
VNDAPHAPTLSDAYVEVTNTRLALDEAERVSRSASAAECDARNKFNEATRRFDAAVSALKAKAPRGTDWHGAQCEKDRCVDRRPAPTGVTIA